MLDVGCGRGDLGSWMLEQAAYDAAVFRHSLEHVVDPVGDLRRVRKALRDGGMVIVTVPNYGCWQRPLFGSRWLKLCVAIAACVLTTPLSWLVNRAAGEGDVLHAIAYAR